MALPVEADFQRDLGVRVKRILVRRGVALPDKPDDVGDLCYRLYQDAHQSPWNWPRRVEWSRELRARTLGATEVAAIRDIERTLRRGGTLRPRLSRGITRYDKHDGLLSDWNVRHLHLGEHRPGEQFCERTKDVLLAFDADHALLLLDILPHGRGVPQPWALPHLLEILYANWPQHAPVAHGFRASDSNLTPEMRTKFRRTGINAGHALKDGTLLLPAEGFTLGGGSAKVSMQVAALRTQSQNLRDFCLANRDQIAARLHRCWGIRVQRLHLAMHFEAGDRLDRPYVVETTAPARVASFHPQPTRQKLGRALVRSVKGVPSS